MTTKTQTKKVASISVKSDKLRTAPADRKAVPLRLSEQAREQIRLHRKAREETAVQAHSIRMG